MFQRTWQFIEDGGEKSEVVIPRGKGEVGSWHVTICLEDTAGSGLALPPSALLRDKPDTDTHVWLSRASENATKAEHLGCIPLGRCRTVGAEAPPDNACLLLALGLPNPALQALCKLITASETGEQLISRVS